MRKNDSSPTRKEAIEAIRATASRQADVIHIDQLSEIGLDNRRVLRWCDDGTLVKVARRVYSLHTTVSHLGRLWAAQLSVGPHSVVRHLSAIDLLDLMSEPGSPVYLGVTHSRPRPQPGIHVRQLARLEPDEMFRVHGLQCMTVARMLLDVADAVTFDKLRNLLDRAAQLRTLDFRAIETQLSREKRASAATIALNAAVEKLDETAGRNRVESERRLIALINDSDLPKAVNNFMLGGFEVDVHWVGTRAIVEADSRGFHSTPDQIARDIAKQAALEAMGFKFLRLRWAEINYGTDRTLARIERFRRANIAPPVPGPPPELILSV